MKTALSHAHKKTYDAVFQHPMSHEVGWREIRGLLGEMGEVEEQANGNLKVTVGGKTVVLHSGRDKSLTDAGELMSLRHFLRDAEEVGAEATVVDGESNRLVVIDHREARVYSTEMHGAVAKRIKPMDSDRHLHYVQNDSNGQRKPEQKQFYAAVIKALGTVGDVLVFGSSTGASSAMVHLMSVMRAEYPAVAKRVVGEVVIDAQHTSEEQLLAEARLFYEKRGTEEAAF